MAQKENYCSRVNTKPEYREDQPNYDDAMCLLSIFDRVDTNKDGFLDQEELTAASRANDTTNAQESAMHAVSRFLPRVGHLVGTKQVKEQVDDGMQIFPIGPLMMEVPLGSHDEIHKVPLYGASREDLKKWGK